MNIFQLAGFALVTTFLTITIKKVAPELAIYIPLIGGAIIFFMMAGNLYAIIKLLEEMSDKLHLDNGYLNLILKMIGISFVAEFAADICKDSGETAVAKKIEFSGKVIILFLAIPVITALLQTVLGLIQ